MSQEDLDGKLSFLLKFANKLHDSDVWFSLACPVDECQQLFDADAKPEEKLTNNSLLHILKDHMQLKS